MLLLTNLLVRFVTCCRGSIGLANDDTSVQRPISSTIGHGKVVGYTWIMLLKSSTSKNLNSNFDSQRDDNEVPTQSIHTSNNYTAPLIRHGFVMMASDWIPNEPLPSGPQFDGEEWRRLQERMDNLVPTWATKTLIRTPNSGDFKDNVEEPIR